MEKVKREIKQNFFFFRFAERAQTDFGVNAVIAWAKEGNLGPEAGLNHLFFSSLKLENFTFQDLFISGDVDEVLSRGALHQLKWCQVKEEVITGVTLSRSSPNKCFYMCVQ